MAKVAGMHWPFDQPQNAVAFTMRSIIFGDQPILYVSHDLDDHGWQFLDGSENPDTGNAAIVAMAEIVERDPTVLEVADLLPGWYAWREEGGRPWHRACKK